MPFIGCKQTFKHSIQNHLNAFLLTVFNLNSNVFIRIGHNEIETLGVDNQFHFYQLPLALLPFPLLQAAQTVINITKPHRANSHSPSIIQLLAPLRKLQTATHKPKPN